MQKTPQCNFLFSQHPEPPNCTGDYNDSHHSSIEKRAEIEILLKHHTDIESVKAFFLQVIYAHAQSHHKVSLRDSYCSIKAHLSQQRVVISNKLKLHESKLIESKNKCYSKLPNCPNQPKFQIIFHEKSSQQVFVKAL